MSNEFIRGELNANQEDLWRRLTTVEQGGGAIVDVYVSQANGDDANDGLTPATAVATAQAFIDKDLDGNLNSFVFHFDSGTHTEFKFPAGWGKNGAVWLVGDGAGQTGDDGYTEVAAAEVSQAGTDTLTVVSAGAFGGDVVGAVVEILDGAAAGSLRHINQVIGDTAYFTHAITGLTAGDSFRIVQPAAVIEYASDSYVAATAMGVNPTTAPIAAHPDVSRCLGMVNLNINYNGGTGTVFSNCMIVSFGLRLTGIGGKAFESCNVFAAPDLSFSVENGWDGILPFTSRISGAPATAAAVEQEWTGWGISVGNPGVYSFGNFFGYLNQAEGNQRSSFNGGNAQLQGGAGGLFAGPRQYVILTVGAGDSWYGDSTYATGAFVAGEDGSMAISAAGGTLTVTSQSAPAVYAFRRGYVFVAGGTATLSSDSTFGLQCETGGDIVIQGSGLAVTGSTPGVNDASVGTGDIAFGSITAGTWFTNGGNTITRE